MKITIRVEDRITRLNQELHSGLVRETPEKQAELEAELLFLRELSRQGVGSAPLAAPFQTGQSWAVPGCAGFYETAHLAWMRSIHLAAQECGILIPEKDAPHLPKNMAISLRTLAATGDGARNAKMLLDSADKLDCLQRIFDELDGKEWTADAFINIAGYLSAAGLELRDSNEPEAEDAQPGPGRRWY